MRYARGTRGGERIEVVHGRDPLHDLGERALRASSSCWRSAADGA